LRIGNEGLEATIVAIEELGSDSFVYCTPKGHDDVSLVARTDGLNTSEPGTTVHLMPDTTTMHVFDTASGARLEG
jgi:multiple sugar transport system ATP-binding protein